MDAPGTAPRVESAVEILRRHPLFAELPEGDLDQMCAVARRIRVAAGDVVMEQGSAGDGLYIIVDGELEVSRREAGREVVVAHPRAGEFIGEMSLLGNEPRNATARAVRDSELLIVPPAEFQHLLTTSRSAAIAMLRTVHARLRSTEALLMQQEKLVSLGTLAAGLAHELNNPAAAIGRATAHLRTAVEEADRRAAAVHALTLSAAQTRALHEAVAAAAPPSGDALASSLEEERLSAWLEQQRIADAWTIAPPLVAYGWHTDRISELASGFDADQLATILHWLAAALAVRGLLGEIEQSTQAMSAIVTAVKSYAYLDRAPVQQVDVPASLESTLLMLRHKLKAGIEVVRDFARDVPAVEAHGSELNQVWTNLIDNAIHAMAGRGTLELRVRRLGDSVVVSITDDGRGIPLDAQSRIFDPFWTTKQPGEGSGLGLHIARNIVQDVHGGRITFASAPGRTTFEVALPIRLQRTRA